MTDAPSPAGRRSLFPDDIEPVQLHHGADPLQSARERCVAAGWLTVDFDVSRWADGDRLHDDVSAALSFPEYYGRNLDALVDQLRALPTSSDPTHTVAAGLLITLHRLDEFVAADPLRAQDIIEIFAGAALHALRYRWPVAVLLQSDDPAIQLAPTAATVIPWNRAERDPSNRV